MRLLRSSIAHLLLALVTTLLVSAAPVEFSFRPTEREGNPFAREIWAAIESPDKSTRDLPAYYAGNGVWSVRTRPDQRGAYRLLSAHEIIAHQPAPLSFQPVSSERVRVRDTDELGPAIRIDPRTSRDFLDGFGNLYYPIGGNLPWASGSSPEQYYPAAFADFQSAGLNWARLWMAHWGQLNLDWVEAEHGEQPEPGHLSLEVADRWDRIVTAAEESGVRLQIALQHHGQVTTFNNSNWAENPWNADLGGFLASPQEFFTDARARELTRMKYRYIVARWGYSSAIMAWELFNEVMWVDSRRGDDADNAAVAAWHQEMARHLRRFDVHQHLITTSDDDLQHALFGSMDYLQPHLYGSNMVLGVQQFEPPPHEFNRPLFYGEVGDDNMVGLTPEQKTTGFVHPILAWSGLFAPNAQPAQIWYVETLRRNDRWPQMQSLGRFVRASGLHRSRLPIIEHPLVLGGETAPVVVAPGHYWHRGPDPELTVPLDGRQPGELMEFRRILASAEDSGGFPGRVTLHADFPAAATARLHLAGIGNRGASLRVTVDEDIVVDERWAAANEGAPAPADLTFPFRLGYGPHTIVIENPAGPQHVELGGLDLGIRAPVLTAIARRNNDRVVFWLRHRVNLLSPAPDDNLPTATATLQIDDLAAADWRLTWWDDSTGAAASSAVIHHPGGALAVPTPDVRRHIAGWLERLP